MKFDFKSMDKKTVIRISLMLLGGVMLLIASMLLGNNTETPKVTVSEGVPEIVYGTTNEYANELEHKLESVLSCVEGAGSVKAMVTVSYSSEKVIAHDETSEYQTVSETDSSGGVREQVTEKTESRVLLVKQSGGTDAPYVLKEIEPKIEGVVIVAEGGGDAIIRDQLMRAVQTALNVELHKVSVLKMK